MVCQEYKTGSDRLGFYLAAEAYKRKKQAKFRGDIDVCIIAVSD